MESNQEDAQSPATNNAVMGDGNCVLHKKNEPDTPNLGLRPQQRSQRVVRQSSHLFGSIIRKKKITVNHPLNDSTQSLQKEHLSDHGGKTVAGDSNGASSKLHRSQSYLSKTSSVQSSIDSSDSYHESDVGDFNINMNNPSKACMTMLKNLGDSPSTHELNKIVAICANEYVETRLSSEYRRKWDNIPQFYIDDLVLGQFLGKGSFSDVVEVFATAVTKTPTLDSSFVSERDDLIQLIDAKFERTSKSSRDDSNEGSSHTTEAEGSDLSRRDDHCDEINAMFGSNLDAEIDAMFGSTSLKAPPRANHEENAEHPNQDEVEAKSIARPRKKTQEHQITLAMKCLRIHDRPVDAEHFVVGVEDLVRESAILASLNHPNIVKIHGRTRAPLRLSDGYFILLDRLSDTLDDRILRWKKFQTAKSSPSLSQIKTACSIADAMSYLHDKKVLFRDLKPTNVGFDSMGVLKLFDFGFAICVPPPESSSTCIKKLDDGMNSCVLYNKCGTLRYMAPEVGMETGYGFPADIHSFGILLWQICALKKPFHDVKSADQFHKVVFLNGTRPQLSKRWPQVLSDIMTSCWSISASDRPDMRHVRTALSNIALDASTQQNHGRVNLLNRSIIAARRFAQVFSRFGLDSDIIEEKVNNNSSGQFVIMNDMDKDKMNEFAHLIRHEDFSKVLQLADKLKREEEAIGQRQHDLSHLRKTRKLSNDRKEHPSRREEKDPNSYGNVAELIRTTLLPSAIGADVFDTVGLMGRGESQITDSLIDDTIHSLANELKLCLDLKGQRRARRESQTFETVRLQDGLHGDDKTNPSANNAIKFLKWQTDILTNWMIAHSENPFPTHAQIYELAKATNLTETQVVNWTTNVRKRNLKGTVELGKKPHHFLDYLFLATDREKQMRHAHPEMNDFLYKGSGLTPRALIHNHKGSHEVLDGTHDPPGRSTIAYPTSRAQTGFTLADHEISRPHLHLEQPDIHRRNLAIPKAQKKTKRIFRRGKGLGAQNEDELAHSMGKIPRQNSERFPMDDVDHYAFNEYEEMYHPKIVSFESMCDEPLPYDNEVPFDENMASYLGMLFADE